MYDVREANASPQSARDFESISFDEENVAIQSRKDEVPPLATFVLVRLNFERGVS